MEKSWHGSSLATLRKGIDLLFLFSEAEPSLRLQDIAARLKLPKSTSYRFVNTLRDAGLLVQDPESREYRLGARLLSLQTAIVRPMDLRITALPFLRDLVEQSGETAHLTERRGNAIVIIEVVESPHVLRMAPRRGETWPLHAGALSRAVLAFLPLPEIEQILRSRTLKRYTPNTPTITALKRVLADVRSKGYATSLQEVTLGACGISAPIFGSDGWAIGSLGISGPMQRVNLERREALAGPVRDAAMKVSELIRHHPRLSSGSGDMRRRPSPPTEPDYSHWK
jgi:IclR family KDG regulon transcriptional repressor